MRLYLLFSFPESPETLFWSPSKYFSYKKRVMSGLSLQTDLGLSGKVTLDPPSPNSFLGNYHVKLHRNALCWKLTICLICCEILHLWNCTFIGRAVSWHPDKHWWETHVNLCTSIFLSHICPKWVMGAKKPYAQVSLLMTC